MELGVDSGDEFDPRFGSDETARGAIDGDDVGSGVADGFGGREVWGDVDVAVGVVGLGDADDREIGLGSESGNTRSTFGTKTACPSAKDGGGHAGEGI